MQTFRRTGIVPPSRSSVPLADLPRPDITTALGINGPATHGEIVAMRTSDPLNDSLEDIWPGLAADTAARRSAGHAPFVPTGTFRQPQCVLDAIAEAQAAKKPRKPRAPKEPKADKSPTEPKARKLRKTKNEPAAAPTPAPAPAPASAPPVAEIREPVRQPAARAALGPRQVETSPLPTAAKRVVAGVDIPARIVGTVRISGTLRASTGDAIIIDVEGQNNVARGIVVWAGPLQDQVRRAVGCLARVEVRQPSNPRFKPSVSAISAA